MIVHVLKRLVKKIKVTSLINFVAEKCKHKKIIAIYSQGNNPHQPAVGQVASMTPTLKAWSISVGFFQGVRRMWVHREF